jgi:hypothetical protein
MSSQTADVATVLALEEPAKALLEAIRAAQPAVDRLREANYPGAESLGSETGATLEGDLTAGELIVTGSLYEIVATLEVFRKAGGDLGAADYHYQVGRLGQSLVEAAAELLDYAHDDADLQRVVGLQRYAATVA